MKKSILIILFSILLYLILCFVSLVGMFFQNTLFPWHITFSYGRYVFIAVIIIELIIYFLQEKSK